MFNSLGNIKLFKSRSISANYSGFTLIELLIVMVILGLLASLVAPKMFGKVASSKQKTAQTQMEMLSTALDMYRLDVGSYPSDIKLLRESNESSWQGPYLPKDLPKDPWGNDYVFKFPGDNGEFDLMSLGGDGKLGGEGENSDITY